MYEYDTLDFMILLMFFLLWRNVKETHYSTVFIWILYSIFYSNRMQMNNQQPARLLDLLATSSKYVLYVCMARRPSCSLGVTFQSCFQVVRVLDYHVQSSSTVCTSTTVLLWIMNRDAQTSKEGSKFSANWVERRRTKKDTMSSFKFNLYDTSIIVVDWWYNMM